MTRRDFNLQVALETDAEFLVDLYLKGWRETYTGEIPEAAIAEVASEAPQRWRTWLAAEESRAWFAVDARPDNAGQPIGFIAVEAQGPHAPKPLYVTALYVLAAHQGRGAGSALLEHATGDAPCYLRVSQRNERAISFYERHGFRADGDTRVIPEWGGIVDLRMVR
ncbi:MAG TPA: GNAT family N-acetyltransferase [Actinomycetaceae bacterium]|nr:GNAT family N-acetyltransferase [Actinomycetaceae bacterium]